MSSELPLSTYSGFCLSQISSKVFCQKKSSLRAHFILLLLLSLPCWWWPSSKKVSGKCPDGRTDSPVSSLNHLTPFLPQVPHPSFLLTFRLTTHWLVQLVSLTFVTLSLSQNKSISGRPVVPFVHSVEIIRMYGASKCKSFVLIFWLIFMSPRKPRWPGRTMVSKVCCQEHRSHCS